MKTSKHIFGYHPIVSVLEQNPQNVNCIYLQSKKYDDHTREILQLAKTRKIPLKYLARKEFREKAYRVNHQGVMAEIRNNDYTEDDLKVILKNRGVPLLLILDGVQDPQNLGSCLRTANAAGADAVIVPKNRACKLTATVYKVASGAVDTIPFIPVTNLIRTMQFLKEYNVWIYGTAADASQDIYAVDLKMPVALVLGGEGKGLRRLTRKACDAMVKIPMGGIVPNLNVAVAAGICLFEVVRQRS